MLFRVILKPSRYVYILSRNYSSQLSSQIQSSSVFPSSSFPLPSSPPFTPFLSTLFYCRHFSSNNNSNDGKEQDSSSDFWKLASENDNMDIFGKEDGDFSGVAEGDPGVERLKQTERLWAAESGSEGISKEFGESSGSGASVGDSEWAFSEIETWDSKEEDKVEDLFDIRDIRDDEREKEKRIEDIKQLEMEEVTLKDVLKGPNRAFGDLVAASGITDDMLDSLFALKDFDGVTGLPPLSEIEDLHYEKTTRKSTMAEMERQKQEEVAKARVRMVDEKGRAYGTGKRKCSIARVWIQPGEGKFLVNDKEFDVYFPMLDHRAALLRPFSETQTLGLWDVRCTVKGGGVSGQVGAVRLGISRALQNWEPGLRPQLKEVGFLTRDPRIVERKKPGKAKARKSFQWVKR